MHTNRLINEDSPYLRQHAHNPVNWFAWNKEAFEKAKEQNKLIFLSIGYSTCHWCHVMERESFENNEIAEILNKYFISIKVDREEMPQIDKYYQDVYYLMRKRGGGWPLTVVLTPDGKPFYADTYIPPYDKYGRAGLKRILLYLENDYKNNKDEIRKNAQNMQRAMESLQKGKKSSKVNLDLKIVDLYIERIEQNYDKTYHGIGTKPKFPHATTLNTLLDIYKINSDKRALNLAVQTLTAMAKGGIYDQIEGGFFRYSTDEKWLIPHFEKMLYTNAELIEAYTKAYDITKNELFKEVAEHTIQNIEERFKKEDLFFSASDADSNGEEGKYFVFSYTDTLKELQNGDFEKKEAQYILKYLGITRFGNFEHRLSNPHITSDKKPPNFDKALKLLKKSRSKKNYPFIDHKIMTSWNALMIKALFKAKIFDKRYPKQALKSLDKILKILYKDGVLYHQIILSKKPKIKALLEDYSFLISALIEAYQYSLDDKYLSLALKLNKEAIEKFYKNNIWYLSDDDFKSAAPLEDSSYQSAAALMIQNILILSALTSDLNLYKQASLMIEENALYLKRFPSAYSELLKAFLMKKIQIIIIKSTKENLFKIKNIKREFVYLKKSDDKKYLACFTDICFAYADKFEELEEKIR